MELMSCVVSKTGLPSLRLFDVPEILLRPPREVGDNILVHH